MYIKDENKNSIGLNEKRYHHIYASFFFFSFVNVVLKFFFKWFGLTTEIFLHPA
jgi:hypothetical protein